MLGPGSFLFDHLRGASSASGLRQLTLKVIEIDRTPGPTLTVAPHARSGCRRELGVTVRGAGGG